MATSGSISASGSWATVTLSWTRTSVDIANNKSTISYTLSLYSTYAISSSASKSYSIVFNGSTVASGTNTVGGSGTRTLKTGTVVIPHNADGTKTFSFSFSQQMNVTLSGTWVGTLSNSGSSTLDTIPRASSISSFPNFTIGNSFSVGISRATGSFTHKLQLYIGNSKVAERTGVGDSYTFTLSTAEQNTAYSLMSNVTSATGTLWCLTYSGSTQIGGWVSKNNTISIGSGIVPSFTSITHSEWSSNVSTKVGVYVQGLSALNLAITGAKAGNGSSIKSYSITFDGKTYNSSSVASDWIKSSGTLTISATVTDNRNRTATKTTTVTVLPYSPPSITTLNAGRSNSDGTDNEFGDRVKVRRVASATSLKNGTTEKNILKYTIKTKLRGTSSWTTSVTTTTVSGLSFDINNNISGVFDVTKSYDLQIEVADQFNTTIATGVISTGQVTMSWGREGVGIGKVWERGALDVSGDVIASGQGNFDNVWTKKIHTTESRSRFQSDGQIDPANPQTGAIMIEGYNNMLQMGIGNTNNDRNAWIQARHNSKDYATAYGVLRLNPLGGTVEVGSRIDVGFGYGGAGVNGEGDVGVNLRGKIILQGQGIEMNWSTPYIDFKDSYSDDYDTRLIQRSSSRMEMLGGTFAVQDGPIETPTLRTGHGNKIQYGVGGAIWYGAGYSGTGFYAYIGSGWVKW
jgi:hypothetical protein